MPSLEVPFRTPTPILFFVITILAGYFSFEPPQTELVENGTLRTEALRSFAWASASFFLTTGPLRWLKDGIGPLGIDPKTKQMDTWCIWVVATLGVLQCLAGILGIFYGYQGLASLV